MPFGRAFRAISLCVSFPGLKPWAVFCSPVGRLELAQEDLQTPVRFSANSAHYCILKPSRQSQWLAQVFNASPVTKEELNGEKR
jgi:hypothetical protein